MTMSLPLVRWLIAFVVCAALAALSIAFADRPLALFVDHLGLPQTTIGDVLQVFLILVPLAAAAVLFCGISAWRGRALPRWLEIFCVAGISLLCAIAVNDLVLKPAFGRYNMSQFLSAPHLYGFVPFHGSLLSSFPSGHTVIILAFFGVYWLAVPRLRWLWAVIIALVLMGLIAAGWHFIADEVAGVFVGASFAAAAFGLWRLRTGFFQR